MRQPPNKMPVSDIIISNSQQLVRRSNVAVHDAFIVPGLDYTSQPHSIRHTVIPRMDITSNTSDDLAAQNSTVAPNYSTGLTGVNLELDQVFVKLIWVSMVSVALVALVLRLWQLANAHIRRVFCLQADHRGQNYWSMNNSTWWPWLKRQVIYAPLGRKRHNREIQLSSAHNYGILPGRVHAVLLLCYVLSNIAYCLVLPYGGDRAKLLAELRGRTGMLATVNLIPLVLMAGRNNPAINLLNISFNTFNLLHRWLGRLIIVESLVHVAAWRINYNARNQNIPFGDIFYNDPFLIAGLCAVTAMSIILFQSLSAVRHAFYEIFLHLHIFLAFVGILTVYIHLELADLPALPYIRTVVVLWICERLFRLGRLVYLNVTWRNGTTIVTVEALPAEACRVTFQLPRHITIRPGSHIYAYIPRISWWQSHPFSVAWTNVESDPLMRLVPLVDRSKSPTESEAGDTNWDLEKQTTTFSDRRSKAPTAISLVVAARTGMTRKLYQEARKGTLRLGGFVEGPYAGHDNLSSYGTVVMFAGGAGITHHLVQIRHLLACTEAQTTATRKIVLVWTIRDLDALTWIRPWMYDILKMPSRKGVLSLELYVTRPRTTADYTSPSSTIRLYPKRCDPGAVLDKIIPQRVGAMMVTVCGPGAFADEVRAAVRSRLHLGCIEMNEEAFTW